MDKHLSVFEQASTVRNYLASGMSLYIHIPYCASVCSYCDFAKTSHYSPVSVKRYFAALFSQLSFWLGYLKDHHIQLASVYFGGGTPSLFCSEYDEIFAKLRPHLLDGADVTLEANPKDITLGRLRYWRSLGCNRLSLGVQSFHAAHLQTLSRDHSVNTAKSAIEMALEIFPVNVDMIYGIPRQTCEQFLQDLQWLEESGVDHLSLYGLSFEAGTPLGRLYHRGSIPQRVLQEGEDFYQLACSYLLEKGFFHEELAHFAREGHYTVHNAVYWNMLPYIGLGAGAHGYFYTPCKHLQKRTDVRYSYKKHDAMLQTVEETVGGVEEFLRISCAIIENERDDATKMLETIATTLRTAGGVPVRDIERDFSKSFSPTSLIKDVLDKGQARLMDGRLVFHPNLWFYEHSYILACEESFAPKFVAKEA